MLPVQLGSPKAFSVQDRMWTNLLSVEMGMTWFRNHFSQHVLGVYGNSYQPPAPLKCLLNVLIDNLGIKERNIDL